MTDGDALLLANYLAEQEEPAAAPPAEGEADLWDTAVDEDFEALLDEIASDVGNAW